MPENRKGFASALHIRGLRQRWMLSAVLPILLLLVLAVALFSVGVQEYYYNAMRSGLESRARIAAETFSGYGVKSYSEYYRLASYSAETFEEKDTIELQFINTNGRVQVSSYGLTAGTLPGTEDIERAIAGNMASFQGRDPQTGENILSVSYPLFFNSRVVGVLRYVTSLREAQHRVLMESLFASAAALVCMALIAASNAIFINNVVQPVAVVSDAARRIAHHRHRLHNVVNKNGIRRRNERHAHERRRRGEQRFHQHPVLCLAQRRYIAQHADHAGIEKQRIGHRKNIFPRLRIAPLKRCHIAGDGALNVLRSGQRACREAVGRDLHAAVRIDKLQFDRVLFLKGLRGIRGKAVVFAVALHAVAREGLRRDARAAFKTRAHRIIVVFLHAHAEKCHCQHKQQQDRQHRRKHPPLAKAADMQRRGKAFSIFRHCSPSFVRCVHTVHL